MNRFEAYANQPVTEERWLAREEEIERQRERRYQRHQDAYDYNRENSVELPEFTGPRKPASAQGNLFEEVA